ncbi:hypothetical protein HNP49_002116 [Pseudomonas fluvialis]|uniref:NTF2 fold domain-containing protein n=1 Tax=Pseudomonas fluvialis TaxID=1793966 RepID=A0A7X0BT19_9PSED|nr:YbbC/YhhH family protein [Pseudomonas fluvialis]MBB6341948.1 hypothetical protein [Pseudomonas fluvialis]
MRLLILAFALLNISAFASDAKHTVTPENGLVPDAQTAISIAVAVWTPIYGEATIEDEQPYTATLSNGVWTVEGSLPKGWKGGVAIVEISQENGAILRVSHGK